jgi:hypothetical protein
MDAATRGWLAFTTRWNRWWLPDMTALKSMDRHADVPSDVRFAHGNVPCAPLDTGAFRRYLDLVEYYYRRDDAIARMLFPVEPAFALHSHAHAP